jgi:hypothetical protein
MEYLRPYIIPYPVIRRIAQNSGDGEKDEEPHHVQVSFRGKGACGKKQRIARQKRGHDKASFTEDDEKKYQVCPDAVGLDYCAQMHINVYDKIENGL